MFDELRASWGLYHEQPTWVLADSLDQDLPSGEGHGGGGPAQQQVLTISSLDIYGNNSPARKRLRVQGPGLESLQDLSGDVTRMRVALERHLLAALAAPGKEFDHNRLCGTCTLSQKLPRQCQCRIFLLWPPTNQSYFGGFMSSFCGVNTLSLSQIPHLRVCSNLVERPTLFSARAELAVRPFIGMRPPSSASSRSPITPRGSIPWTSSRSPGTGAFLTAQRTVPPSTTIRVCGIWRV